MRFTVALAVGPRTLVDSACACSRPTTASSHPWWCHAITRGHPGAAHCGIVAAYLDEILGGAVVRATGKVSVTGELTVRYVRPAPIETPLLGRGRLMADLGRYVNVEGSLEEFGAARVVATARGRFFPFVTTGTRPGPAAS